MKTFDLTPRGPFSLDEARRFLGGFAVAIGCAPGPGGRVELAFPLERTWEPVGASLYERDGRLLVDAYGSDPEAVAEQTARIFSLDVDATDFPEVGRRDPVVAALQRRYPGLRPVLFFSPYEAAVWALLSQRTQMLQAERIKRRMAETLGEPVRIDGSELHAFPGPRVLRDVPFVQGVPRPKIPWLQGIGEAALLGALDARRLRGLQPEEALAQLRKLPGVGPFSAGLILIRGVGTQDLLPPVEPRLAQAIPAAYGAGARLEKVSQTWRPWRSWVTLLLRMWLAEGAPPLG